MLSGRALHARGVATAPPGPAAPAVSRHAACGDRATPVPRVPGARRVAARIHIDRRLHLENSWRRQQERAELLQQPLPPGRVLEVRRAAPPPRHRAMHRSPCVGGGGQRAHPL